MPAITTRPGRPRVAPKQAVDLGALAGTGFRGERKPFNPTRCGGWHPPLDVLLQERPQGRGIALLHGLEKTQEVANTNEMDKAVQISMLQPETA